MRRGESRRFGVLLAGLGAVVAFGVAGTTVLVAPVGAAQSQDVPAEWIDISAALPPTFRYWAAQKPRSRAYSMSSGMGSAHRSS